jgi:hypothetical protein
MLVQSRHTKVLTATIVILVLLAVAHWSAGQGRRPSFPRTIVANGDEESVPVRVVNAPQLANDARIQISNPPSSPVLTSLAVPTLFVAGELYTFALAPGISVPSDPVNRFRVLALGSDGWIEVQPATASGPQRFWLNTRYVVAATR